MAYDDKDGRRPQNGQGGYGQGYGGYPNPYGYGNQYGNQYGGSYPYDDDYDDDDEDEDEDGKKSDEKEERDEAESDETERKDGRKDGHAEATAHEEEEAPVDKKKLSRKERKELEKKQYELEKKLVKAGKIAPRIHYAPHHTFGRILGICLAFFFGIFMALGGILGGIYIAGTKTKTKNLLDMTGADANAILTETAQQMSLLEMVDSVKNDIEVLGGFDDFSLDVLAKYTPIIEEQLGNYLGQLSDFGVNLEPQQVMAVKFSNLSTFLQDDVLKQIALADISAINQDDPLLHAICFKEDGSKVKVDDLLSNPSDLLNGIALADVFEKEGEEIDPIMKSLLYDKEGNKYKIGDLTSDASGIVQDLEIETLLAIDGTSNSTVRYLAYGTEFEEDGETPRYDIDPETNEVTMRNDYKKRTVSDLTAEDADLIGGAKIGDLVEINEESSGLMHAMEHWSVSDLSDQDKIESLNIKDVFELKDSATGLMGAISGWTLKDVRQQSRIERLKISQVINLGDNPSALLSAIGEWRIRDLGKQEKIDSLTISDVITVNEDSPLLMQAIQSTPLGELGDAIDSLRLSDILSEEDLAGNKILRNLTTSTLSTLSEDVKNLSVADVFGEDIYSYLDVAATKSKFDAAAAQHAGDDIGTIAHGTYAELVNAYGKNKKLKHLSEVVPEAVTPAAGESIESYHVPAAEAGSANPTKLGFGYFTDDGHGAHALADVSKISHKEGAYFMEQRLSLTPEYSWKVVNYAADRNDDLPDGDSVTDGANGFVYHAGTDEYEIQEDGYGYFYKRGDERVDLERVVISYRSGNTPYALTDGKIEYDGQNYIVRNDEEGSFVLVKIPAIPYYYDLADTTYSNLYTEDQTVLRHVLVSGGSETVLDRYLSGVWYLLLGGEKEETDGTLTVLDNSESSVLDIGDKIAKAADVINEYDLGEMYLHGLITSTPYRDISGLGFGGFDNLNELNIPKVIELVDELMKKIESLGA